jgi:phage baseplate assembly protein V
MNKVPGVVIGIVRSLDDAAGEGRIQVEFPWLSGEYRSTWAPIATPLAGNDRGMFFMPEPDDEVLVAFEHGDMDHPFVVGFLWNGKDRPPESDPALRVIRTPGGHTLRFEDTDGAKRVVVQTHGELSIVLDDSAKSITLAGGGRQLVMAGGSVAIK